MSDRIADRETYRKIKKMSREELENFLLKYADKLLKNNGAEELDLSNMREDIGKVKGIGEKRLDEIMKIIEGYLK
ncbi:MAG: hypothetical protein ACI4JM_10185 [Oscillospiraceae bacterium]